MRVDEVIRGVISRAGVVRVRSALNPFLWAIVWSVIFLLFAWIFETDPWANHVLIILAAIPMIVTMAVGCFFAFTEPDRLQSEGFVLKQLKLSIAERKGQPPPGGDILAEDDVSTPELVPPSTKEE